MVSTDSLSPVVREIVKIIGLFAHAITQTNLTRLKMSYMELYRIVHINCFYWLVMVPFTPALTLVLALGMGLGSIWKDHRKLLCLNITILIYDIISGHQR